MTGDRWRPGRCARISRGLADFGGPETRLTPDPSGGRRRGTGSPHRLECPVACQDLERLGVERGGGLRGRAVERVPNGERLVTSDAEGPGQKRGAGTQRSPTGAFFAPAVAGGPGSCPFVRHLSTPEDARLQGPTGIDRLRGSWFSRNLRGPIYWIFGNDPVYKSFSSVHVLAVVNGLIQETRPNCLIQRHLRGAWPDVCRRPDTEPDPSSR